MPLPGLAGFSMMIFQNTTHETHIQENIQHDNHHAGDVVDSYELLRNALRTSLPSPFKGVVWSPAC